VNVDDETSVVYSQPAIICGTSRYNNWKIAVSFLLVYVALVPFVIAWFLIKNRLPVQSGNQIAINRYGILFEAYNSQTYFWGIVVLVRQILLVGLDFAFLQDHLSKYLAYTYFNLTCFLLQIRFNPFNSLSESDNPLEASSLFILTLISACLGMSEVPISQSTQIWITFLIITFVVVMIFTIVKNRQNKIKAIYVLVKKLIRKYFNKLLHSKTNDTNNNDSSDRNAVSIKHRSISPKRPRKPRNSMDIVKNMQLENITTLTVSPKHKT
jgi:hypothetical protein